MPQPGGRGSGQPFREGARRLKPLILRRSGRGIVVVQVDDNRNEMTEPGRGSRPPGRQQTAVRPPWLGSSQREVTTLPRVKRDGPPPCAVRGGSFTRRNELFHPPERWSRHRHRHFGYVRAIIPTLTSFWNCRAAPPSLVKIAVPLPYGLSLIIWARRHRCPPAAPTGRARRSRRCRWTCRLVTLSNVWARRSSRPRLRRQKVGAVHHQGGSGLLPGVDVARHPVPGDRRHQGPHVAAAGAVTGAQSERPLLDLVDQLVGDVAHRDHGGDGHAALAGGAEAGVDGLVRGQVEVGVRQHQHMVLRATECLHSPAVRGAGLIDVAGDGGGADEGDRGDVRVGSAGRRRRPCRRSGR